MRDSIRLMFEIEEELALQPHHSRVGLTLSQHRQRLLAEVQYYLERTGIEEEIQLLLHRRLRQRLSSELSHLPVNKSRLQSDSEQLDTDLGNSQELYQSPSDQAQDKV
jgi:hypothetical protein